jgi:hypothetical protein
VFARGLVCRPSPIWRGDFDSKEALAMAVSDVIRPRVLSFLCTVGTVGTISKCEATTDKTGRIVQEALGPRAVG